MTLRFLDTDILLYSVSRDPSEAAKRDRAVALSTPAATRCRFRCCKNSMCKQPARPGDCRRCSKMFGA
jgi:hypothetical protein